MTRWEYISHWLPVAYGGSIDKMLNSYGIKGWELVSVISEWSTVDGILTDGYAYYFKRPM